MPAKLNRCYLFGFVKIMSFRLLPIEYISRLPNLVKSSCWLILFPSLLFCASCGLLPPGDAQNESSAAQSQPKLVAVDGAIAREGSLKQNRQYIGTTFPVREVVLRSRVEGQILDVAVDDGDRIRQGQLLARIDDAILASVVLEAEAELAALQSEVTSLQADVDDAIAQVERSQFELKQAQADAGRSNKLLQEGAVAEQEAELDQTAVSTAEQSLQSARQQVENRRSAVVAAQRRVAAQAALVAQEQKRQSLTLLTSPVTGSVLERVVEPGDLAQSGDEIFRLGDLSQIKIQVQISELDLGKIRVGQTTQVKLDAFPQKTLTGKVSQISLAAEPNARLIPVEITIPNENRLIGKGLLARVDFSQLGDNQIVVPETTVEVETIGTKANNSQSERAIIFVLQQLPPVKLSWAIALIPK